MPKLRQNGSPSTKAAARRSHALYMDRLIGRQIVMAKSNRRAYQNIYHMDHDEHRRVFGTCSRCDSPIIPKNQSHAKKIFGRRSQGLPCTCMECLIKKGRRVYRAKKVILARRGTPLQRRKPPRVTLGGTALVGFIPVLTRTKENEVP